MTLIVGKDVAERVRRAARQTPDRHTLSEIAGVAMERSARVLEYLYHGNQPFPRRTSNLKVGPPPLSEGQTARHVPKARMTVYVDPAIAERFRNAVYYTPTHETISGVISRALGQAAKKLERERMAAERKRES
jgi:hypothetical protein